MTAPHRGTPRRRARWLGIGVALALGVAAVAAVAGLDAGRSTAADRAARLRAQVSTTAAGTVIARRADRSRGLLFEVESSPAHEENTLSVALSDDAPAVTRAAVLHHLLAGRCDVPREPMLTFFGRWDRGVRRFRTELAPDDPRVVIALRATVCELYVGRPGKTPDTAVFPKRPFSRVRMR